MNVAGAPSANGGLSELGGAATVIPAAGATSGGASAGGASSAGAAGVGGAAAGGGVSGAGGAPVSACPVEITGSATRPQLTDASAACFTPARYLSQTGTISALTTDNWDPSAGLPAASTYTPTYTVATDGSGTHSTIQAAIAQAKTTGGAARVFILVKPGPYRELVCVDGTTPITLYGADTDASKVTIAFDNYNGKAVDLTKTNACAVPTAATYGTSGSSTFFVKTNGFQAQNLTIANDFAEGALTTGLQAVALTSQADKAIFQNVRVLGNQDTLQLKSAALTTVARSYFKGSYIEGDTDFIFGRGTAVFDDCTLMYVAGRKTNSTHLSPSTESNYSFGFLVIRSKISGAAGIAGTTFLGRAWDDSSATSPNGQALIRETEIAAHINVAAPWTLAATTSRPFDAKSNRLYEYKNTGPGAAP